ncbi:MAG: hypothetical protein RLZZ488_609 [Pseudomonadota bacterium]|jgi:16S rRNA processing protein RimM
MRSNHGTQSPLKTPEGFLWLGQVGRPHGVRGAFFLKTQDNRSDWPGYSRLLLQTAQGERMTTVQSTYVSGGKLAVQLREVSGREECEALYNAHLFVARGDISTVADEYVVGDLVGCRVEVEGREGICGVVIAIHNFGAQETLEIERSGGGETILFPFLESFIVSISEKERCIVVRDVPEFLDGQAQ